MHSTEASVMLPLTIYGSFSRMAKRSASVLDGALAFLLRDGCLLKADELEAGFLEAMLPFTFFPASVFLASELLAGGRIGGNATGVSSAFDGEICCVGR